MGRVSKHKKIKAWDPFYKGPINHTARSDNLPPSGPDDQPVPKSLLRILQLGQGVSGGCTKHTPNSNASQQRHSDSKKLTTKEGSWTKIDRSLPVGKEKEELAFKRRKGETLKDYLDRIDVESRARLVDSYKANRKQTERRKKYYDKRKQRLEVRKGKGKKEEDVIEFTDLKDDVQFGEVVSAPPQLMARPRGSGLKARIKPSQSQNTETTSENDMLETSNSNPTTASSVVVGLKRKQDIADERERLIQEYRLLKKAKLIRTKGRIAH